MLLQKTASNGLVSVRLKANCCMTSFAFDLHCPPPPPPPPPNYGCRLFSSVESFSVKFNRNFPGSKRGQIEQGKIYNLLLSYLALEVRMFLKRSSSSLGSLRQTDAAAVNQQISIQKDSRPSEFSRPLTLFTL